MDALRFASTKIQPPRLRSTRIARPRLDAALREAMALRRVVLLLAPAGFGKTCALAAQFDAPAGSAQAHAWIALDEDDDPPRAFACMVAALEPFDLPWRTLPDALLAQLGEGDAGVRRAVAELVNALSGADVAHGVIVLDDVHRVQNPAVHALLDALIERLPARWTLVLSTRAEPPLALARLRVADELAEFGQQELRFDAAEAAALAAAENAASGLPRAEAAGDGAGGFAPGVAELFERTQGWPAGMRLCLAALRTRAGGVSGLAAGRGSRIDHHLFDYLAGEVLDDMPGELHDFLLRCSVLPALTDARCALVSGDPRAAERLDEVERRSLFVTVLDAEERTLVLHDLFREALDERLRRRFADELPQLLRRAADSEADPLRRVGFLLRAADHRAAEDVLLAASDELLLQGGVGEVGRAIEQFPVPWRERSARLLRLRATCLAQSWQWSEMSSAAAAAVEAARAAGDAAEMQLAQAYLAAAWHNVGRHVECLKLLDELRAQSLSPLARAFFYTTECGMLFRAGKHAELVAAYAEQLDALERGMPLFIWWSCAPSSSWMSVRGMRALVERFCRGALQRLGERETSLRVNVRLLRAFSMLWAGDIDGARAESAVAAGDLRWLAGSAHAEANLIVHRALIDAMCGRAEPVREMLDAWLARASGMDESAARAWCHDIAFFAIRVHAALGSDPSEFERWARHLGRGSLEPEHLERDAALTAAYPARLAAAQGHWEDAAALYRRALGPMRNLDSLGQTNEIHLRSAHAWMRCGQLDAAAAPLVDALARIRAESERGHALMCGSAVLAELAAAPWGARLEPELRDELAAIAALAEALHAGAAAAGSRRAATVPRTQPAPGEPPRDVAAVQGAGGADEPLSVREREVLERIAAGDSNKLIARALDISPHTVKRHVGNILDKLALASRGQAAAWLRAHP